ncbi:hypothetical protein [Paractinoplanes toevensis]|uniref:Uncharacterized protein n=1 Tax=Paractinoplanes toevensis TaxID=571911 RepID=A0A919W342_9ACTN|nr:hypothetical protein [Actinoplanes toevensis]GIM90140.1 hypothetical protein Ato02nite_019330 [Actinoplanes toevensis]
MNEHFTPEPADAGTSPVPSIDLVAGDPPVPITVWRTARSEQDTSRSIPTRLAYRIVAAYSHPGEAVIDLTDGHAMAGVTASGGRVHHKAWFSDIATLTVGPPSIADETDPPAGDADPPGDDDGSDDEDAVAMTAWFGDDLTHPDPAAQPSPHADADVRMGAALVVANWPLDPSDTTNHVRLSWLLAACSTMLRPGGCLVLVVAVPTGMAATPQDFTPVVKSACRAGLGYLQHIVAVAADTDGDTFSYHATDEELIALQHARAQQWFVHITVHADLLVFTPTGGEHRD